MTRHSPASSSGDTSWWKPALRTLGTGTLFFLLFGALNAWVIEPSDPGNLARRYAYDWQQLRLAVMRRDPTQVAVVDISWLPPCPDKKKGILFPRTALVEAINAVLAHGPAAIAIDIDFARGPDVSCGATAVSSPPVGGAGEEERWDWTARGGPVLFDLALELRQRTPIYLGVFRTQAFRPEQWLGAEKWVPLAAAVVMPPEPKEPSEEVFGQRRYIARAIVTGHGRLPSMSEVLYRHRREPGPTCRSRVAALVPHWIREEFFEAAKDERFDDHIELEEFLVDFSANKMLRASTATFVNHALVVPAGQRLQGKLVLLGNTNVKEAVDKFQMPGTNYQEAGVYWHAAGVDTLIRGVLVQPTDHGREMLDALFYFPWLVFIVVTQLRSPRVNLHGLQSLVTKWAAGVVLIVGLVFVQCLRLMWDDFVIIAVLLAAHPTLERWTIGLFGWFRDGMKTVWQHATEQE